MLGSAAAARDEFATHTKTQDEMPDPKLRPDLPLIILSSERPETVLISLMIAHKLFAQLPSAVSVELLDAIAEHCMTFKTRGLVSEVIDPWVERLAPQAIRSGDLRWLRIGWAFWLDCIYYAQANYWVWASTKQTLTDPVFASMKYDETVPMDLQGKRISYLLRKPTLIVRSSFT
jgi:hypothetical protein